MDQTLWGIMNILGPALLLLALVILVLRRRTSGKSAKTEAATRDLYREEEKARREGTEDL